MLGKILCEWVHAQRIERETVGNLYCVLQTQQNVFDMSVSWNRWYFVPLITSFVWCVYILNEWVSSKESSLNVTFFFLVSINRYFDWIKTELHAILELYATDLIQGV